MKIHLAASLFIMAFLVSGCAASGDGQPPELKTNEIVVLENVEAVPSEIKPERTFVLSGFVTNKAGGKINNVKVELSDYCSPVFDVTKTSCAVTVSESYAPCSFSLNLDASNRFQWNFRAPPAERTAGRDFDCNILVKTNYSYVARGVVGVSLANDAEIAMRETPSQPVTGDGPLKIYLTVESPQPVGRDDVFDLKIIVRDEGEGEVEHPIHSSRLRLTMPPDMTYACDMPEEIEISRAKKESGPVFCVINTPDSLPPRVTKTIIAEADYDYKFSRSVPVKLIAAKR